MAITLAYSGLLTKIKAMSSDQITDKEYEKISQMDSVAEYVTFLNKKPSYNQVLYDINENNVHRGQLEEVLRNSLYMDFKRIAIFATPKQRKKLTIILFRYEIDILKNCLEYIYHKKKYYNLSSFYEYFKNHSQLDIDNLLQCNTISELIGYIKGTPYYKILSNLETNQNHMLKEAQTQLDIWYFDYVWKHISKIYTKKEQKSLYSIYGTQIDLQNIVWIYRSKKFYQIQSEKILSSIIPIHYKLKKEQMMKLIEVSNMDEFKTILGTTYYHQLYDETKNNSIETVCFQMLQHVYQNEMSTLPQSIIQVFYYLHQKEQEINRITTALECIRYKLQPEQTLHYINNV